MRSSFMFIPIITFFSNIVIWLDLPIIREVIVFVFLTFIPGFVILKLFKLKEISLIQSLLLSVALSITLVMFMGFFVNELYLYFGISQSLSPIPLTVTISAFTLIGFFSVYKRGLSETLERKKFSEIKPDRNFLISIFLFLLPLLSVIGVLVHSVFFILLSCAMIATLFVLSVVSGRLVQGNLAPLLIFSISVSLLCQVLLTSKYILGWDANLEYYVFRMTQINGHWSFLNPKFNELATLNFNSMLSITLLPAVYSFMMKAQGEIVFKILYPFILSLIPLAMFQIFEKPFGKRIALLSALFFVSTPSAFYGVTTGINRQIVGELFLLLSVFLLIDKTIPLTKRRLLLIIFGAALVVSHYSLAFIYLGIVGLIFIISRMKPEIDDTLNVPTVLLLFGIAFIWYALETNSPLVSLIGNLQTTLNELFLGQVRPNLGDISNMVAIPQVFTAASWINLSLSGITYLFLIIGVFSLILRPKAISALFKLVLIVNAVILAASIIAPSIAAVLNFDRFYGITLLFLSPCFIFGGKTLIATIEKIWVNIKHVSKNPIHSKGALLLVAVILSAYFLSKVGFVNRVTGGAIHSYNVDFDRKLISNNSQVKAGLYYDYIPEQDVFSASWLLDYRVGTTTVYCDQLSGSHVLLSYGLIPNRLLLFLTNSTIPMQGSFIFLGSLNIVDGVVKTETKLFNTSEISYLLNQANLIYSNGNSQISYVAPDY